MIYFDENKQAYGYEIESAIATVEDEVWAEYASTDKWDIIDGVFTDISDTEEYQDKIAQQERERIAKLYLTGADVERGIYRATGMNFDDVVAFIESQPESTLDIKAIKIELKANHFYRGNDYVNAVGTLLGFTSEQLDKFFEYNDYTYLLPVEEPEEPHTLEDESNVNS